MKILHVLAYYFPHEGGAERFCKLISKQHAKKGHKITILTSDIAPPNSIIKKRETTSDGIEIYRLKSRMFPSRMPFIYELDKKIKEFSDYDIIHAHTPYPTIAWHVTEALKDLNIPLVTTHHCDYTRDKEFDNKYEEFARLTSMIFIRDLFKKSKRITISSISYAKTSSELKGFEKKIKFIPMCSDLLNTVQNARQKTTKENYILFVGRLIWYKGLDYLINAFLLVKKKHPDIKLKIIGRGSYETELKKLAQKHIKNKEDFTIEYLPDKKLPDAYRKATVFVLPAYTRRESFGIVLREALFFKTPVVVFDIPGVNEFVKKSKSGLIAKTCNSVDLANKISLLIENKKLNKACAENGKKYIQKYINPTVVSNKLEKLYLNILKNKTK